MFQMVCLSVVELPDRSEAPFQTRNKSTVEVDQPGPKASEMSLSTTSPITEDGYVQEMRSRSSVART